jgi:hypothetical protein
LAVIQPELATNVFRVYANTNGNGNPISILQDIHNKLSHQREVLDALLGSHPQNQAAIVHGIGQLDKVLEYVSTAQKNVNNSAPAQKSKAELKAELKAKATKRKEEAAKSKEEAVKLKKEAAKRKEELKAKSKAERSLTKAIGDFHKLDDKKMKPNASNNLVNEAIKSGREDAIAVFEKFARGEGKGDPLSVLDGIRNKLLHQRGVLATLLASPKKGKKENEKIDSEITNINAVLAYIFTARENIMDETNNSAPARNTDLNYLDGQTKTDGAAAEPAASSLEYIVDDDSDLKNMGTGDDSDLKDMDIDDNFIDNVLKNDESLVDEPLGNVSYTAMEDFDARRNNIDGPLQHFGSDISDEELEEFMK